MILIEEDKIKKLENGDFSEISLNNWFENYAFKYIFAAIKGCDRTINFDTLNFISIYVQHLLIEPNKEIWNEEVLKELMNNSGSHPFNIERMSYEEMLYEWDRKLRQTYECMLKKIILVSSRHDKYRQILVQLSKSKNDNVRLYCCANGEYLNFFNDPSIRIQKVAHIRCKFDKKWNNLDVNDIEKERIRFLTTALEQGVIECGNGDIYYSEKDQMFAEFSSMLFKKAIWIDKFDKDIFYTIHDKRILADELNKLIKEGKLSFKDDMVPDYFRDLTEEPEPKIKIKK